MNMFKEFPIHNLVLNVLSFGLEKENLLISLKDEKNGEVYFLYSVLLFRLHIITRVRWVSPLLPFQVVKEFFFVLWFKTLCYVSLFLCYTPKQKEQQQEWNKTLFAPRLYTDFKINRQIYLKIDDESPYFLLC